MQSAIQLPASALSHPTPPPFLQEYIKLRGKRFLGEGTTGSVYMFSWTFDGVSSVNVAVKRINHRYESADRLEQARESIRQETSIMAAISHPYIPRFYGCISTDTYTEIIMEYIKGRTLEQWIHTEDLHLYMNIFTERTCCAIIIQLLKLMVYLNGRNIAHRDWKPANIMLRFESTTNEPHVYVLDFGLAQRFDTAYPICNTYIGTPLYASTRVLMQETHNPYIEDVYSVGMIFYALLYGEAMFENQADSLRTLVHLRNNCPPYSREELLHADNGVSIKTKQTIYDLLKVKMYPNKALQSVKRLHDYLVKTEQ